MNKYLGFVFGALLGLGLSSAAIQMRLLYLTNEIYRECSIVNVEDATKIKYFRHEWR